MRRVVLFTALIAALALAATALASKQFFKGPFEEQPDANFGLQIVKKDGKVVKVQAFGSENVTVTCQLSGEVQLPEQTNPGHSKVKHREFDFQLDSDEGNNGHNYITGKFNKTYSKLTGTWRVEFDHNFMGSPNPADHCDSGVLNYTATKDKSMP